MVVDMQIFKSITILIVYVAFVCSCGGDTTSVKKVKYTGEKFTKTIPSRQFKKMYEASSGALLIDVRTKEEFQT